MGSGSAANHGTAVAGLVAAAAMDWDRWGRSGSENHGPSSLRLRRLLEPPRSRIDLLRRRRGRRCDQSLVWGRHRRRSLAQGGHLLCEVQKCRCRGGRRQRGHRPRRPATLRRDLHPGGLPFSNIIAVGATQRPGQLSLLQQLRPTLGRHSGSRPGHSDHRAHPRSTHTYWPTGLLSASPIVAGAAALLLAHDPGIGHQEVIARLKAFADRPPASSGTVQSGRLNIGRSITNRFVDTAGLRLRRCHRLARRRQHHPGLQPACKHQLLPHAESDPRRNGGVSLPRLWAPGVGNGLLQRRRGPVL